MKTDVMLFDPRTGERRPTSYKVLEKIIGKNYNYVVTAKSRKVRIKSIGCYIVDSKTTNDELREFMKKERIEDEYWKDIPDSRYQVSNYGRYRSLRSNGEWRFMIPQKNQKGVTPKISLTVAGKRYRHQLNHFVFELFVEKPEGENLVRIHKDNNKFNNHVSNLAWVTKTKCALLTAPSSKSIPVVRINMETGEEDIYDSMADAGRDNFCNRETIRLAIKENRPAVGYMWKIYNIEED